jgi:ABC-type ATPase with predicted acetyltransferase domain
MNYLFNNATGAPVQPVPVVTDANIIIEEILKRVPVAAFVQRSKAPRHPNISILHAVKMSEMNHLSSTSITAPGRTNHLRNCMILFVLTFVVLMLHGPYSLCGKAWPLHHQHTG